MRYTFYEENNDHREYRMIGCIDLEMITHQHSKVELVKAEGVLNQIAKNVMSEEINSSVIDNLSRELDALLTSAFGYKISMTRSLGQSFSTLIIPSEAPDITYGDMNEVIAALDIEDIPISENYAKKEESIDEAIAVAQKTLSQALNTEGVLVDLEKGMIRGLDSGFVQIINTDYEYVFDDLKITVREAMAAILHEVGHMFFYISELTNTYKTATMVLDTIKDTLHSKKGDIRDTVRVVYDTATGDTESDPSTVDMIVEVGRVLVGVSDFNNKNGEYHSDVFASRHGYGNELITLLDKLSADKTTGGVVAGNILSIIIIFMSFVIYLYLYVISILMMMSLVLMPVGILLKLLIGVILDTIMNSSIATIKYRDANSRTGDNPYDVAHDRMGRVRKQMISSLKDSDISKSDGRMIIRQIDNASRIIESYGVKKSTMDKLKNLFSRKSRQTDIVYLVEDLMNSELALSSARIKNYK